jgi:hypothetical protein
LLIDGKTLGVIVGATAFRFAVFKATPGVEFALRGFGGGGAVVGTAPTAAETNVVVPGGKL